MYLARKTIKRKTHYYLRESYRDNGQLLSRDLFHLGADPARYIVYSGGNSFYLDEQVLDSLSSQGVKADYHELESLFWPFLKSEIRRVLEPFYQRGRFFRKRLNREDEERIRLLVHIFDKRRLYYLKYCQIDQRRLDRMPGKCFGVFLEKSRDEIEQFFMEMERVLRPFEWKEYVFAIFDLHRFFTETFARVLPQALNQEKVERYFLQEICRLNRDQSFWAGMEAGDSLHPYLVRYVIMFFDNKYGPSSYYDDYVSSFIHRKRRYEPPSIKSSIGLKEMSALFGVGMDVLKKMKKSELTRLYRKKAKKFHPDKGGKQEMFIKLTEGYNELLRGK